jgi:tRNA 2-(methylsulfanyl)-N6-isopentenyladenosine37 hydroxylase
LKFRIDLKVDSAPEWVNAVIKDFDFFLADHADCERKASSMMMSFVAKYPDRTEIIPQLIDTAVEEMEHFRDVYMIMEKRGIQLNHEIQKDHYLGYLLEKCRNGREERFLDRLLIASVVESRGAERFRLVYENLSDQELKRFYQRLWASEAKHGEIFIGMALKYFQENVVLKRLEEWSLFERESIESLPIRPALH